MIEGTGVSHNVEMVEQTVVPDIVDMAAVMNLSPKSQRNNYNSDVECEDVILCCGDKVILDSSVNLPSFP